jgi:RimJ/RimL family protein N-acetyltransferase
MSPEVDTFATPRLAAARLGESHFAELDCMHSDERVMATLGGVRAAEQTRAMLEHEVAHWERHGFGLWIFRDRASGEFAGRAGLRHVAVEGVDEVELAYALMAPYWNRGLATEMGTAILALGFDRLGLDDIVCFTMTTNHASRRVMEKLGFRYERDFERAGLPHRLHRLRCSRG